MALVAAGVCPTPREVDPMAKSMPVLLQKTKEDMADLVCIVLLAYFFF